MRKLALAALGLPLLAACATIKPEKPMTKRDGGVCSDSALQRFVGQPATVEVGAAVLRSSGAKTLQWVGAGMMVTMDYREDRVRVYLDQANKVARVACG